MNTLYSCIAVVSDTRNFKLLRKPPFISDLAAEDRCHLNGMCILDGRPRFVTAVSRTDVKDGWGDHRMNGGVVIDVESGETIVDGLSMPHSPRFYDDRLSLLNSGAGNSDLSISPAGRFNRSRSVRAMQADCLFFGRFTGMSGPRENGAFIGLMLDEDLDLCRRDAFCGLLIVDIDAGTIVEWAHIARAITELYDTAVLPEILRPSVAGFKTNEIKKRIAIET